MLCYLQFVPDAERQRWLTAIGIGSARDNTRQRGRARGACRKALGECAEDAVAPPLMAFCRRRDQCAEGGLWAGFVGQAGKTQRAWPGAGKKLGKTIARPLWPWSSTFKPSEPPPQRDHGLRGT